MNLRAILLLVSITLALLTACSGSNPTNLPDATPAVTLTQEQAKEVNDKEKADAAKIDPKATAGTNSVDKPVDPDVAKLKKENDAAKARRPAGVNDGR
jgi:predicted component of type VI protein secretion system